MLVTFDPLAEKTLCELQDSYVFVYSFYPAQKHSILVSLDDLENFYDNHCSGCAYHRNNQSFLEHYKVLYDTDFSSAFEEILEELDDKDNVGDFIYNWSSILNEEIIAELNHALESWNCCKGGASVIKNNYCQLHKIQQFQRQIVVKFETLPYCIATRFNPLSGNSVYCKSFLYLYDLTNINGKDCIEFKPYKVINVHRTGEICRDLKDIIERTDEEVKPEDNCDLRDALSYTVNLQDVHNLFFNSTFKLDVLPFYTTNLTDPDLVDRISYYFNNIQLQKNLEESETFHYLLDSTSKCVTEEEFTKQLVNKIRRKL